MIPQTPVDDLKPPLAGPIADAIDEAMHKEGLTVDIRRNVLIRIRQDSRWLMSEVMHDESMRLTDPTWVLQGHRRGQSR
jgi:hypothetical protein